VVEGLSGLMREVVAKNMFKGFSVGKERSPVELFQYDDYTIFFGEPTIRNIMVLKSMLRCYELALGLKLNFSKSSFRGVGVKRNTLEFFVNILNCMLMSFPFVYLGLSMGANPRLVETWKSLLKKVDRRLAKWKHRVLSMAGRVCLFNSILSSIFLFYVSFFKMPSKVIKEVVRKQRKFL